MIRGTGGGEKDVLRPRELADNEQQIRSRTLQLWQTRLLGFAKFTVADDVGLQRSIRHRFPYIDPLHHLQAQLVRRYRVGPADERVHRGIHISINDTAAGLRNTG